MRRVWVGLFWGMGLSILLSPFFFTLYRLAVFNTVPHDDYAPYLLWLDGNALGELPGSPYCYRLLSVAMAWPFYRLLPLIPLTNLPDGMAPEMAKATAALAMMSYLAGIATALLTFRLARREAELDRGHAIAAGALAWVLGWYTQITAIDSLALLGITLALCVIRRPVAFAAVVLVSVGVNEKIALVLALWLVTRWVLDSVHRWRFGRQALAAIGAVAVYGAAVAVLRMPGNEYQQQPGTFLVTVLENLAAYASARGMLLNVLPIVVLLALAAFSAIRPRSTTLFGRADILVIPALAVVALVLTHLFQAGRIVMHAAPLFVVPAVAAFQAWFAGTAAEKKATMVSALAMPPEQVLI
jgi:hypothetical protein